MIKIRFKYYNSDKIIGDHIMWGVAVLSDIKLRSWEGAGDLQCWEGQRGVSSSPRSTVTSPFILLFILHCRAV